MNKIILDRYRSREEKIKERTVSVPCPSCNGRGEREDKYWTGSMGIGPHDEDDFTNWGIQLKECGYCDGIGKV